MDGLFHKDKKQNISKMGRGLGRLFQCMRYQEGFAYLEAEKFVYSAF